MKTSGKRGSLSPLLPRDPSGCERLPGREGSGWHFLVKYKFYSCNSARFSISFFIFNNHSSQVTQVTSNMGAGNFVAPSDSQPSTSTLSQYPEYVKKKAPLPGKKIWAMQQQQQEQQQQQQLRQQQATVISQPPPQQQQQHFPQQQQQRQQDTCHVAQGRAGHVSVIQTSQHVYQAG